MLAIIIPEEEHARVCAARQAEMVAACEEELEDMMPPLLKALKELRSIDKSSIAELKVMKSPPAGVKLVMRCVFWMCGRRGGGGMHGPPPLLRALDLQGLDCGARGHEDPLAGVGSSCGEWY